MEIIMKRALLLSAALALLAFPLTTSSLAKDAAKAGEMCGGIAGVACDKGLFCEYLAGKCGVPDLAGKCEKTPDICKKDFKPVCGCDHKLKFDNDCERKAAGAQKDHDGPCDSEKAN
jgi:hypothetical protein